MSCVNSRTRFSIAGFDRQPLHRAGAVEADDAFGVIENVLGVGRLGDRAAVAQHQDLAVDALGGVVHCLDASHALVERQRRGRADRALGRQPHVRNQNVGAGLAPCASASSGLNA